MLLQNNWSIAYNDETGEQKGKFLITNIISGIKSEQKVGQIKFKIKEDAKEGVAEIKFKNIISNDGGELISEGDKSVSVKIEKKNVTNKPNTSIPDTNNTPNTNNTLNTNNIANTNNIQNTNNTPNTNVGGTTSNSGNNANNNATINVSPNKIPYTGASDIIKVALVLIGVAAIVTYVKYKNIKIK